MTNYTATFSPIKLKASPAGFYRFSRDYYYAAKWLGENEFFSPLPYFLHCRSIEHILKAALLDNGFKMKALKEGCGHNLGKLFTKVEEIFKTSISQEDKNTIQLISKNYNAKEIEYFEPRYLVDRRYLSLPNLNVLKKANESLLSQFEHLRDIKQIS